MSQFLDPGHGDPCRHCSKGLKVCCQPFVTPPNSKPAYVYLIEVELYIAKEVISFPSVLHNSHYIVAGSGSRMAKA